MKVLTIASIILLSLTTVAAELENSTYAFRHQTKITRAVSETCYFWGSHKEVSKNVEVIKVDQGITDYKYTTVVEVNTGAELKYAEVKSSYADLYDYHENEWGSYTIDSVKCL